VNLAISSRWIIGNLAAKSIISRYSKERKRNLSARFARKSTSQKKASFTAMNASRRVVTWRLMTNTKICIAGSVGSRTRGR